MARWRGAVGCAQDITTIRTNHLRCSVLDPDMPPLDVPTPAERVDGALVQIGLERLDEAEEELLVALRGAEAARDDETTARAQEGLGSIAVRRGMTSAAIDWFELVLETAGRPDPAERIELYRALGQAYSESGRSGPAIALFEECLGELERRPAADPATLVLYSIYLSHGYGDAGDYGRAAAALADALRRDVEDIDRRVRAFAYHALARLYCTTGHTAQALVYADKQVELTEASGNDWHAANAHLVRATFCSTTRRPTPRAGAQAARRLYGTRMSGLATSWVVVEEARLTLRRAIPGAVDQARSAIRLLGTQSAPGDWAMPTWSGPRLAGWASPTTPKPPTRPRSTRSGSERLALRARPGVPLVRQVPAGRARPGGDGHSAGFDLYRRTWPSSSFPLGRWLPSALSGSDPNVADGSTGGAGWTSTGTSTVSGPPGHDWRAIRSPRKVLTSRPTATSGMAIRTPARP
jgi:tetratricopeptide (TPR) repeat protein